MGRCLSPQAHSAYWQRRSISWFCVPSRLSWPVENLPYLTAKEPQNQHFTFWIREMNLSSFCWHYLERYYQYVEATLIVNTCFSCMPHPVMAPADSHAAVVQLHGNSKQKKKTLAGTLKLKVCYRVNNIPTAHIFVLTSRCPVCSNFHCWEHFNRQTRTCKSGFAAAERKQKFQLWTALEWFNVMLKERARI